ncbi:myosin phosphatase Rho-interacting protein isoform X1 [Physeter macrocephalus]|uniref:Myosin phosphatase Rho-interacting protein isoform X1 n=1 Tax=Physeter macrocephalus TaxID=9755 RepID=A0A9W2X4Z7_PHYMC|nr:myosin phosphatase Rho-interacting protein isoform X1 [Physeter catodon]
MGCVECVEQRQNPFMVAGCSWLQMGLTLITQCTGLGNGSADSSSSTSTASCATPWMRWVPAAAEGTHTTHEQRRLREVLRPLVRLVPLSSPLHAHSSFSDGSR